MKMSYLRIVSDKDSRTNEINTQRFFAEEDVKIDNLDPLAKQKMMTDVAKDLHLSIAIMLRQMLLQKGDE